MFNIQYEYMCGRYGIRKRDTALSSEQTIQRTLTKKCGRLFAAMSTIREFLRTWVTVAAPIAALALPFTVQLIIDYCSGEHNTRVLAHMGDSGCPNSSTSPALHSRQRK